MSAEEVAKRKPIDSTARLVTSAGTHHEFKQNPTCVESDTPMPTHPAISGDHAVGSRRCRLTVVGRSVEYPGKYVCRCDCGTYVIRSIAAINNPKNKDRCSRCNELRIQKRNEEFRRLGYNTESSNSDW